MATTDVVPRESSGGMGKQRIVNDMSIQVATVNGSGSQSSNTVLLRSIFQMGVPVSGKNMFPSNIAGLPTWYTIRANKHGYIGRKKEIDFLVAMNSETAVEDTMSLAPGAAVLYDEPLALHKLRNDLIFYSVPYDKIVAQVCPEAKLRKLVKNMVYVGVVASLLTIDMAEIEKAIRKQFAKKVKPPISIWQRRKPGSNMPRRIWRSVAFSTSSAWIRPPGRSSSTAIPRLRWAACSQDARWSRGIRSLHLHRSSRR
jgi:2-oxoglutarate ferredoxin oxidoreductase subunit alpha